MELVYVLRTLWQRKYWVLGAFVLALLAAMYVRFDLSPGERFGVASQEILLDAPSSTLGDLGRNIEPLTARGGVFARVLTSEEVVAEIGRKSGIPAGRIAVQGPPLMVDGIPDQASRARRQGASATGGYRVSVLRGDNLPLLTASTRAPTPEEAARLANGTTEALVTLVERVQQQSAVPKRRRLTIRVLGKAQARQAVVRPESMLAFAAFLFVFGGGLLVILIAPGFVRALREVDPGQPPAPTGATGNGNGDGQAEPAESLDAVFEKAIRAADDPSPEGAPRELERAGGGLLLGRKRRPNS